MRETLISYISGLPWNGSFLVREGIFEWSPIKIHGFYTVSYYDSSGKKIWDIVGILPKDIDMLIDYYALKPSRSSDKSEG
jgi:hypothetical protein|uniref:Uncharacterized protein n=1 Tax=candidate division WOR-3 bacterium TaxID=2052148 RepID=A0A7C6EE31_UNCW3